MFERLLNLTGTAYVFTRAAIILALVIGLCSMLLFGFTQVDGPSMETTLHSRTWIYIDKLAYRFATPQRGDIVNLRFPGDPEKTRYIKRIVGLPGEKIEIKQGQVWVNSSPVETVVPAMPRPTKLLKLTDKTWTLGPDQYFMMGDNQAVSNDSRIFGPVEQRFIIGLIRYVIWPPSDFNVLN